jgi:hypothetical protein
MKAVRPFFIGDNMPGDQELKVRVNNVTPKELERMRLLNEKHPWKITLNDPDNGTFEFEGPANALIEAMQQLRG